MSTVDGFFEASFGRHKLLVVDVRGSAGRDVIVQSPSRGDLHRLNDRGRVLRDTTVELVFTENDQPDDDYLRRFFEFRDACNSYEALIFTHPIDGAYLARCGSFSYTASASDLCVKCSVQFLEDREGEAAAAVVLALPNAAGVESVTSLADAVATAATAAAVVSVAAPSVAATAAAWADAEELSTGGVFVDLSTQLAKLDAEIDRYEDAIDVESWQVYKSMLALRFEFVRAAAAATRATSRLMEYTTAVDSTLRQICTTVYGLAGIEDRVAEVAALNSIRTPGFIRAGTVIKLPSDGAR